ncbi:hypothetical protein [Escherichia phage TR2]|nr:hypothetical protein [Escherichia phage TR2]WDS61361.1 hypothetical protein CY1_00028 [Escherichia phage CY1_Cui-2023]
MFLLDVYKFCEGYRNFNRQHLARFIYKHKDCARMAKAAGVDERYFASSCSKEFMARMLTAGYLDGVNGVYWSKGSGKRPFQFEFMSLEGKSSAYVNEMMNIATMSDEELFA